MPTRTDAGPGPDRKPGPAAPPAAVAVAALALAFSGCGGGASTNPVNAVGVVPAHGGSVLPLPSGRGFFELVVEPVTAPTKAKAGAVVVYFLKPDGSGPLDPAPAAVIVSPPSFADSSPFSSRPGV